MPVIVFAIILEITSLVVGTVMSLRPLRMIAAALFDLFVFLLLFPNGGLTTMPLIIFVYLAYLGLEFRHIRILYPLILASVAVLLTVCIFTKREMPTHDDMNASVIALNQLDTKITDERFEPKNVIYRTMLASCTYDLMAGDGDTTPVLSTPIYTNPRYAKEQGIVKRAGHLFRTESKLEAVRSFILFAADGIALYILEWPIVFFGLLFLNIFLMAIRYWKGREDRAYAKWDNELFEKTLNHSFDAMMSSSHVPDHLKNKLEVPKGMMESTIREHHYCQEKKFQKLTNEELIEAEDLGLCILDHRGEVRHADRTVNHHFFDHIKDEAEAEKKYQDLCAIYGTYGTAPNAMSMNRLEFEYDRYKKKHKGSPKKISD